MIAANKNNWFNVASFSLLLVTIILFRIRGNYFVLLLPFAYLYFVLLGVNWQLAYWIFWFSIPASIQINYFE